MLCNDPEMAIEIELQDENGKIIGAIPDDRNLTFKLIPPLTDKKSVLLRFINPYGDTVFNTLQAPDLKFEIESSLALTTDIETAKHWRSILKLVDSLANGDHLYLKFIGD